MKHRFLKGTVIVLLSLMLLVTAGSQPAHAVDKSRVFIWLLFLSGLGSSAAGAVIQGQANETYDQYLHAASQADMDKLIDDYDREHQQSIIASRTGIGVVVGAILLSLIDLPPLEVQESPNIFGSGHKTSNDQIISAYPQDGELLFTIGYTF